MRRRFRAVHAIGGAIALAGCAAPADTPSGQLEYTYRNVDVGCLRNRFTNGYVNQGYLPRTMTDNQLVFERQNPNMMASALLGSGLYPFVNERRTVVMLPQEPNTVRVIFSGVHVTNPGSAFERLTPMPATAEGQAATLRDASAGGERACAVGVVGASPPAATPTVSTANDQSKTPSGVR